MLTFIAYPLVRSLYLSLFKWNGITKPQFIGLQNFDYAVPGCQFLQCAL